MAIYKGDVGTILYVETGIDLTGASVTNLRVRKPVSGTIEEWTGIIDPLDSSQIKYTIQVGDFDEVGKYEIQSVVTIGTWSGSGEITNFTVYNVLEAIA